MKSSEKLKADEKPETHDTPDILEKPPVADPVAIQEPLVHYSFPEVETLLLQNGALRQIVAILVNGKRAQRTPQGFPAHDVWLQRMLAAHTKWVQAETDDRRQIQGEEFLHALQRYLELIPMFTPHCGRPEQAGALVEEVRRLIGHPDIGFGRVSKRVLSILNAP